MMNGLHQIPGADLRAALSDVDSAKAAQRLMIALAYKDGVAVDALSERYGIPRSTIYYWLDRFEDQSLDEAIADKARPGRPPKLTSAQRRNLRVDLEASPKESGYCAESWSPDLVRHHIEQEYEVQYSLSHGRRLLRELTGSQ